MPDWPAIYDSVCKNIKSSHTAKYKPWRLVTYIAFADKPKAEAFERYLKSGSGHAFARKHLW
jgi:putative endonuclease